MPSTQRLAHPIEALASALRLTSRLPPAPDVPATLRVVPAKWPASFALTASAEGAAPAPAAEDRT